MTFPLYILEYFDRKAENPMASQQSRQAAHRARRVANGARQKSFLLSPEVVGKLEKLAGVYGSETKAIEALILGAGED